MLILNHMYYVFLPLEKQHVIFFARVQYPFKTEIFVMIIQMQLSRRLP